MIRSNPTKDYPQIHKSAYIDPTAVIIGNVKIGKNVFVGPLAVIRADEPKSRIIIMDNCNIQDRVIIHALARTLVEVGRFTSLSHGCIVHGPCRIGKNCFIGFGSIVFKAQISDGVVIKHLAVVEKVRISAKKIVDSSRFIKDQKGVTLLGAVNPKTNDFVKKVVKANLALTKGYKNE